MKSRLKNGIEVKRGSGNVYADLGLADAEKLNKAIRPIHRVLRSILMKWLSRRVSLKKRKEM